MSTLKTLLTGLGMGGCFACVLGGPERRTLFIMAAKWLGPPRAWVER